MRNAAKSLMRDAVECGYKLRVYYTHDNSLAYSTGIDVEKAYEATQDCDLGFVYLIKDSEAHHLDQVQDWALIIHGNDDDELISDHTIGHFIDRWQIETDYGQESMSQEFKQRESI